MIWTLVGWYPSQWSGPIWTCSIFFSLNIWSSLGVLSLYMCGICVLQTLNNAFKTVFTNSKSTVERALEVWTFFSVVLWCCEKKRAAAPWYSIFSCDRSSPERSLHVTKSAVIKMCPMYLTRFSEGDALPAKDLNRSR